MKIRKITQILIVVSVIAIIFILFRLDLSGVETPGYLIWNLFLAWIPYIISSYFIKKETSISIFIPLFIFWLLFFPNAPYLVTDVTHIVSSPASFVWYDSLLFFFFGWVGLLLGMVSLYRIHQYFKNHLSNFISELIIFVICFVSSFGVYLGRFERWNSWDLFLNPFNLIKQSVNISADLINAGAPLIFVGIFTIFMYSVYKTVYILIADNSEL
ncbi:MAG: DUF1361 domain-containing protein [Candidatus Pacebacteria bacterium]|nr:DUF1361 domain-containing protein [Candidatus Paceibacterota bacterium]